MSIAYDARDTSHNAYASPLAACHMEPATEARSGLVWLLFSFQGRASRSQYWGANILAFVGFCVFISLTFPLLATLQKPLLDVLILIPTFLIVFWMIIAIEVKRWQDRGKSGLWFLIGLVPYVGALWKLIELGCLPGTAGRNNYGPDAREDVMFTPPQRTAAHALPRRQLIQPRRVASV